MLKKEIEKKILKIKKCYIKTIFIIVIILIRTRDSCMHLQAAQMIKMKGLSHFL